MCSSWAHPARHYTVSKLKQQSNNVETTYKLLLYERDIKVMLTAFVEFIEMYEQ